MQFSRDQSETLIEIMKWRRDVRHFSSTPIPEDVMTRLGEAMELSPSVGNSRPWRVLRIRDEDRRARVSELFERCNKEAAASYTGEARQEYLKLKLAGLREAPEHLAFFTETEPQEGRGLGRQTMPETLFYSTVMAMHTLWLAARAENIGLGWVSILEPGELAGILDAEDSWRFTGYLCLGYPTFTDAEPLLHRKQWQSNKQSVWATR
ncbi:5,6-dimethylbenzimidazole synthase [Henriciella sp.]|uniref:5,6-dimethylbenzimidazole synthase n=1 Tax=Henriciella sp. TaxID=1968823 RepID=UPI0026115F2A|nr:5,6-dimethylbenzimidazole synthase [Henriciella sp.]